MDDRAVENVNMYKVLGWVSFVLGLVVTPLFAILGIILGVVANKPHKGDGTAVIWANSVLLIVGLLATIFFYGIAGLAFFELLRIIRGSMGY